MLAITRVSVRTSDEDLQCVKCKDCIEAGETFAEMGWQPYNSNKAEEAVYCAKCADMALTMSSAECRNAQETLRKRAKEAEGRMDFKEHRPTGQVLKKPKDVEPLLLISNCGMRCPKEKKGEELHDYSFGCDPCTSPISNCDHLGRMWYSAGKKQYMVECWHPAKVRDDPY